MRSAIAIVACVFALGAVNWTIVQRERHLESGRVVYLELAPVDPRSLMQGDYMALAFRVARDAEDAVRKASKSDGRVVAKVGSDGVARYSRLDDGTPIGADEVYLRYRVRAGTLRFATNAWFFEEGTAQRYEAARYGEFRVADDGELLLTRMRDNELKPL